MEIIEIARDNAYNNENDFSNVFNFTVLGTEEQRDEWYYKDDIFVAVRVHLGGDPRGNYGATRLYRTDNLAEGFLDWTVGWDVESWDMSDTSLADYETEGIDDKFISEWCGDNTLLERDEEISERCSIGYASSPTSKLYSQVGGERCFWHDGSAYIIHDSVLYRCTPYHYLATVDTPADGLGYTCDAAIDTESFLTEVLGNELDVPDEVAEKWDYSDEVIKFVQAIVDGELEDDEDLDP